MTFFKYAIIFGPRSCQIVCLTDIVFSLGKMLLFSPGFGAATGVVVLDASDTFALVFI